MILRALLRQGCGRGVLLGGTLWGGGAVIRLGRWFRSIRKKSPPFSVWSARNTSKIAADWSIPLQKSCSAPKEACTFCMIPVWDRHLRGRHNGIEVKMDSPKLVRDRGLQDFSLAESTTVRTVCWSACVRIWALSAKNDAAPKAATTSEPRQIRLHPFIRSFIFQAVKRFSCST